MMGFLGLIAECELAYWTQMETSLWYWFKITSLVYVKTGRGHTHESKP